MAVFTSGIVLLLSIWGGKRSGLSTDPHKEMADVHKCMEVLRACEDRWHSAGRLWCVSLLKYFPSGLNKLQGYSIRIGIGRRSPSASIEPLGNQQARARRGKPHFRNPQRSVTCNHDYRRSAEHRWFAARYRWIIREVSKSAATIACILDGTDAITSVTVLRNTYSTSSRTPAAETTTLCFTCIQRRTWTSPAPWTSQVFCWRAINYGYQLLAPVYFQRHGRASSAYKWYESNE